MGAWEWEGVGVWGVGRLALDDDIGAGVVLPGELAQIAGEAIVGDEHGTGIEALGVEQGVICGPPDGLFLEKGALQLLDHLGHGGVLRQ